MDSIWREIEQLREAPLAQVRARYREIFQEEPRSQHREHLLRRLAWRLQATAYGGLSETARQRAEEIGNEADVRVLPPRGFMNRNRTGTARFPLHLDPRIPRPGTLLKRDYRGSVIIVEVLDDGFKYQGRRYGSLSAIASEATGTRWNGLAVFGLARARRTSKRRRHA